MGSRFGRVVTPAARSEGGGRGLLEKREEPAPEISRLEFAHNRTATRFYVRPGNFLGGAVKSDTPRKNGNLKSELIRRNGPSAKEGNTRKTPAPLEGGHLSA